jgi:LysM repeat protein
MQAWGTSTAIYVQTAQAMGLITPVPTASATPGIPPAGAATSTPTTPAFIVPTATLGRPATYTLQTGEFPYCIARRFNVDPNALLSLNGLSSGEVLQPGLILNIPQTGSFPGTRILNAHPAQYTVGVDDTIYRIACHYGDVDPSSIAAANGIALSTKLTTGQILNIP